MADPLCELLNWVIREVELSRFKSFVGGKEDPVPDSHAHPLRGGVGPQERLVLSLNSSLSVPEGACEGAGITAGDLPWTRGPSE